MKYGLIGERLGHSFSKEIHEKIASYTYEICPIAKDKLGNFFKSPEFVGINVTIPYKESVIPYLDTVSENAQKIGAVNTVKNENGTLCGYNTDYEGMRALINHAKIRPEGKKALILGTGGTSKTAKAVLKDMGASEIVVVGRSDGADISYSEMYENHTDAQIIINTTPVGMYPKNGETIIDISKFPALKGVVDAIYNPLRTSLVLEAKKRGIRSEGGLYMLVSQAIYASKIFTGSQISDSECEKIFKQILKEKENIVLIGMPSSGKTTTAMYLSSITGRSVVDTDDEIIKKIGMPISEYFALYGEEKFREVESEVIREVSAQNGIIIATGGGAVLKNENVKALKQNGRLYFLNRSVELLTPTSDRPTASDFEALRQLYFKRHEIYKSVADEIIPANGTIPQIAEIIKGEFFQ